MTPATATTSRGVVLVVCATICWSSGGLIVRLVGTGPWTTSLWRSLFAALFLAVALWIARGGAVFAPWRRGPLLVVGALMALASTCFILSLAHTSVADTLILISTGPYVAGLLGWLLLGERVAPARGWPWASPSWERWSWCPARTLVARSPATCWRSSW